MQSKTINRQSFMNIVKQKIHAKKNGIFYYCRLECSGLFVSLTPCQALGLPYVVVRMDNL